MSSHTDTAHDFAESGWGPRSALLAWWILAGVLIALPWRYGSVQAAVQLWLAAALTLALVLSLVWLWHSARRTAVRTAYLPAGVLVLWAAVTLGGLQLVPLPAALYRAVAPGAARWRDALLPAADSADAALTRQFHSDGLRPERRLSLCPAATRQDLAGLVLASCAFTVGALLCGRRGNQARLLAVLAINGGALALFGLVQQLATWWAGPARAGGAPFASFVNRNNAAGYLNLCLAAGLGLAVWLWPPGTDRAQGGQGQHRRRGWRQRLDRFVGSLDAGKLAVLLGAGLMAAAVLCTLSRGGVLAMCGAGLATGLSIAAARRTRSYAWGLAAIAVLALGLVMWVGRSELLRDRLATLLEPERLTAAGRVPNWRDALSAMGDFWPAGSGLGTYRYVYVPHEHRANWSRHHRAENQYVEALLDAGVVGLALMLAMLMLTAWAVGHLLRRAEDRVSFALAVAGVFALASQAIHALFDFGLYIPANAWTFAVVCGACAGAAARQVGAEVGVPRARRVLLGPLPRGFCGPVVATLLVPALLWSGWELWRLAPIERAMALADIPFTQDSVPMARLDRAAAALHTGLLRRSDDAEARQQLATLRMHRYSQRAFDELRQGGALAEMDPETLWRYASPVQVHGRVYALARDGVQDQLGELRQDPLVREELWDALRHALLARDACPMMPQAHLQIAVLCGLAGPPEQDELHLRRVRLLAPGNAAMLYLSGLLHLSAERRQAAYECWRESLRLSPAYAAQIVAAAAADRVPQADLVQRVLPAEPTLLLQVAQQHFAAPDQAAARQQLLRRALRSLDAQPLGTAESDRLRAQILIELGRPDEAIAPLERTVRANPSDLATRYRLATLLLDQGRTDDALEHARWCARMQPESQAYRRLLERVHQRRLQAGNR